MLEVQYNGTRAYFEANQDIVGVAWNGLNGSRRVFMTAARDAGARTLYFELSPFAGCITVDPEGVNYENALPREISPYKLWLAADSRRQVSWRAAGDQIQQRRSAKPKVETSDNLPPLTDPFLFVPLQVPGDSQLRLFGGRYKTVDAFVSSLVTCSHALPAGWHIRVKEHPSAERSIAALLQSLPVNSSIYLDNATETFEQVRASRGVITVNSSVGLEAMFFDKPVIACGQSFWAIDGVAHRAADEAELAQLLREPERLSLDDSSRNAFMSFLTEVYYPRIAAFEAEGPEAEREASKIADRLTMRPWPNFGKS
jgi:capsular polysaccharide export protein